MQAGNGCLTSGPSPCMGHRAPRQPPGLCSRAEKTLGKMCREEPEYSATLVCTSPHTHVCTVHPHTCVHHSASATARPASQPPPSHPSVRLSPASSHRTPLPPSLPPPPERFRSVSIDKSGALPRRRCNGAQRVRGCRGAQAHGGVGVRGARLGPRVGLYTCDLPGVWLHTCGVSQVCGCTRVCTVPVQTVHACLGVHT